jgi:hypothetical protein
MLIKKLRSGPQPLWTLLSRILPSVDGPLHPLIQRRLHVWDVLPRRAAHRLAAPMHGLGVVIRKLPPLARNQMLYPSWRRAVPAHR